MADAGAEEDASCTAEVDFVSASSASAGVVVARVVAVQRRSTAVSSNVALRTTHVARPRFRGDIGRIVNSERVEAQRVKRCSFFSLFFFFSSDETLSKKNYNDGQMAGNYSLSKIGLLIQKKKTKEIKRGK